MGQASATPNAPAQQIRIDKWLWYARVFKSRSLASKFVASGKVRKNKMRVTKASAVLSVGDVLTFPLGKGVRVYEVVQLGTRRGPAVEAQTLYIDLLAPPPAEPSEQLSPMQQTPIQQSSE